MKSFRRVEMLTQPGNVVPPTVDCFTRPGSVQMVGDSKAALDLTTIKFVHWSTQVYSL